MSHPIPGLRARAIALALLALPALPTLTADRKSTRLNSSH